MQIAERKKLVSSIKSTSADSTEKQDSSEQMDGLLPSPDFPSRNDESSVDVLNGSSLSVSNGNVAVREQLDAVPSSSSRPSDKNDEKQVVDLKKKIYNADPKDQLKGSSKTTYSDIIPDPKDQLEGSSKTKFSEVLPDPKDQLKGALKTKSSEILQDSKDQLKGSSKKDSSDFVPAFLSSKSSHSTVKEGKDGQPSEPTLKDDSDSVETAGVGVKPPPLAGVNVMNVIIVAAECAPWSKTGILLLNG